MDVSDGLAGDLAKMCRAARLDAVVDVARVPLSRAARAALAAEPALIETILTGGDDYEVLAAVPGRDTERLRQAAKQAVSGPSSRHSARDPVLTHERTPIRIGLPTYSAEPRNLRNEEGAMSVKLAVGFGLR